MASFAGCNIIQPIGDAGDNAKIKIIINNVEFDMGTGALGFDATAEVSAYEAENGVENLTIIFKGSAEGLLIECEQDDSGGGMPED